MKEGTVSERDPEAGWTKKNGKSHFGYKAHVAVDEGSEIIRTAILTSADLHDSQPAAHLIRGDEHAVYGDKAYASQGLRDRLADAGINRRPDVQGGPQQAAEALAELVQQGRRQRPLEVDGGAQQVQMAGVADQPDVADAAEAVTAFHDPEAALDGGTDRRDRLRLCKDLNLLFGYRFLSCSDPKLNFRDN